MSRPGRQIPALPAALVGALFVGIAFQPFIWMLIGMQIGFDTYVTRRAREAAVVPAFRGGRAQPMPG